MDGQIKDTLLQRDSYKKKYEEAQSQLILLQAQAHKPAERALENSDAALHEDIKSKSDVIDSLKESLKQLTQLKESHVSSFDEHA